MMKIIVQPKALNWYVEELDLREGDFVRFFARYGGCSTVQKGFSLGLAKEPPLNIGAKSEINGVTFFIEENDLWYFDNNNLTVDFDEQLNEPIFRIE